MKHQLPKFYLIILLVLSMVSQNLMAGLYDQEVKKVCHYSTLGQPFIELNNQYGEIQVIGWDKDSVRLETTIRVSSDKHEDLDKLTNMVEVTCRGNESNIVISTEWSESASLFKRSTWDIQNKFKTDTKLSIDYKIYLPIKSRLSITNRFGDVYLPDYEGPLRVNISHGDLRAREISDARRIDVKYGKVLIKNLKQGLLKVEYGSLILEKAGMLTLESRSSTLEIAEVNRLAIKCKNDELRIDAVNSLRGEASLSHIRARNVSKFVDVNTSYGDVSLKEIGKDFELIRLEGASTDYDLEFVNDAQYRFEVESINGKSFSFPQSVKLMNENEDGNTTVYEGFLGTESAKSLVKVYSKSGYVNFYGP